MQSNYGNFSAQNHANYGTNYNGFNGGWNMSHPGVNQFNAVPNQFNARQKITNRDPGYYNDYGVYMNSGYNQRGYFDSEFKRQMQLHERQQYNRRQQYSTQQQQAAQTPTQPIPIQQTPQTPAVQQPADPNEIKITQQVPIPFGEKKTFPKPKISPDGKANTDHEWNDVYNLKRYCLNEFQVEDKNLDDMHTAYELISAYYNKEVKDVIQFSHAVVESSNKLLGMAAYSRKQAHDLKEQISRQTNRANAFETQSKKFKKDLETEYHQHTDKEKLLQQKLDEAIQQIHKLKEENDKLNREIRDQYVPFQAKIQAALESAPPMKHYGKRTGTPERVVNLAETDEE